MAGAWQETTVFFACAGEQVIWKAVFKPKQIDEDIFILTSFPGKQSNKPKTLVKELYR